MNWTWFLFSFKGRFNRAKFWLIIVILAVFSWIASMLIMATGGAMPMVAEMKAAKEKCGGLADEKAKSDCLYQNVPMFAAMKVAQERCAQLTDQNQIKECNEQAAKEVMKSTSGQFLKFFIRMLPIYFVTLWISLAAYVKRFHDLDKSGWFTLLYFIPLVNIAMFIWQGFFKGTTGANKFGPDPLQGNVVV